MSETVNCAVHFVLVGVFAPFDEPKVSIIKIKRFNFFNRLLPHNFGFQVNFIDSRIWIQTYKRIFDISHIIKLNLWYDVKMKIIIVNIQIILIENHQIMFCFFTFILFDFDLTLAAYLRLISNLLNDFLFLLLKARLLWDPYQLLMVLWTHLRSLHDLMRLQKYFFWMWKLDALLLWITYDYRCEFWWTPPSIFVLFLKCFVLSFFYKCFLDVYILWFLACYITLVPVVGFVKVVNIVFFEILE